MKRRKGMINEPSTLFEIFQSASDTESSIVVVSLSIYWEAIYNEVIAYLDAKSFSMLQGDYLGAVI